MQWICDLIDEDNKEWKKDLVSQYFLPEDRDAILGIPLSATSARDRVIWAENKNGKFTVKSAHRLVLEEQWVNMLAEGSDQSAMKQTWKRLWQMNVPNKVIHFAWKVGRNILATKENLRRRNITKDSTCDICGKQVETISHLFWFCDHAKEVWSSFKLSSPFEIQPSWDYMDVIWLLQKWEEARPGLLEKTLANERPNTTAKQNQPVKWDPPLSGCYKVNVDGAVFSKLKQADVGVVIRDEAEQVVAALSRKLHALLRPLESEAKAMEVGVKFALEIRVRDVLFEGDSLQVTLRLLRITDLIIRSVNSDEAVSSTNRLKAFILNAFHGLLNSDEAFSFFEAFHALLAFLVSLLAALIGLHFQVLGVSPLDTHFALILLFIMATIVYSIAYSEIKLQPPDAGLPIFRIPEWTLESDVCTPCGSLIG
ncbi:hypothetical protein SO802_020518 [Lithocarpus litseifolius]|uniref:Reverse transcriptase zinc-binding domain-containing protein n=1 Tax=Lithocarpus litseifolius TaxID=425828 RepID=A0AAW2CCL9_9ROSI